MAVRLKLDHLFLKRPCRMTRIWQEALQLGMWHRKHLHGCWQWCHPAAQRCHAVMQGPGKLQERALELVQATLYLQAAESRAGREAEVSTGSTASLSQIRESVAMTENCYSCTICDRLFSELSVPSSCHVPLLLLLQEFLPSELSALHTWLTSTCA